MVYWVKLLAKAQVALMQSAQARRAPAGVIYGLAAENDKIQHHQSQPPIHAEVTPKYTSALQPQEWFAISTMVD
jgi:hypothetical protein